MGAEKKEDSQTWGSFKSERMLNSALVCEFTTTVADLGILESSFPG